MDFIKVQCSPFACQYKLQSQKLQFTHIYVASLFFVESIPCELKQTVKGQSDTLTTYGYSA